MHAQREETAKSAVQRGERAASQGDEAKRAGKPGLAARHYASAASNHLDLHPSHGSLESQITKAKAAFASAGAAHRQVSDRNSARRLDSVMSDVRGKIADMEKFAAMKPEAREAEVIKRNQNSRMR
jgi:hypothetical protein